jgi:phage terminase small subunit
VQRKGSEEEEEEEEEEKLEAFLATSLQKSLRRRSRPCSKQQLTKKPIATLLEIFCNGFEIWFTMVLFFSSNVVNAC